MPDNLVPEIKQDLHVVAVHHMDRIREAAERVNQDSRPITILDVIRSIRLYLDDLETLVK